MISKLIILNLYEGAGNWFIDKIIQSKIVYALSIMKAAPPYPKNNQEFALLFSSNFFLWPHGKPTYYEIKSFLSHRWLSSHGKWHYHSEAIF